MKRICFIALVLISSVSFAQDTLPNFSVKNIGNNRYVVEWVNNYDLVKQISIQRSHDSLKNFTTILSVPDPNAKQNGFADTRAPNDHMYYRLFVVLDKGQFYFTQSKKPVLDTFRSVPRKTIIEKDKDTVVVNGIKPIVPKKPEFVPSFYVYTNKDGYVFINLPDAEKKKYRIKFFEEDGSFLFEINTIKETALTLDKTNFMHAGWFRFELYNDDELVEKNKFYLAKEF
jgi:Diaminopimelate epimerase